jgi:hypothetical protein
MKKCFLTAAICYTLVGCSGGVGSEDVTNATNGETSTSGVQREKGLSKSKGTRASVEMPLAVLIYEANAEWETSQNVDFSPTWDASDDACFNYRDVLEQIAANGYSKGELVALERSNLENIVLRKIKHLEELKKTGDITQSGEKQLSDLNAIRAKPRELCARLPLKMASTPIGGWFRDVNEVQFVRAIFMAAYISNAIQTEIVLELGDQSLWKSDQDLKDEINNIISEIVDDGRLAAITAAGWNYINSGYIPSLNKTGNSNFHVEFSLGGYNVGAAAAGISTIKSGSQWFGNGYISSKLYKINVESLSNVTVKKSKIVNDESNTSQSATERNTVSTGN